MSLPFQDPTPSDGFSPRILTIGGGKGGIGKSFMAASLGHALAQRGVRVLIADMDLGGANLHAWLGMPPLRESDLGSFLRHEGHGLEDLIVQGPTPGLSVIHGAVTHLGASNIKFAVKQKLLGHFRRLAYDWIIVDLGAGNAYNTVDFFLLGSRGLLMVTPERTSIENAYRFLRAAALRALRNASTSPTYQEALKWAESHAQRTANIHELIARLSEADPGADRIVRATLRQIRLSLILNQVWELDELKVGHWVKLAAARHLGLQLTFLGPVRYDEAIIRALRRSKNPVHEIFAHEGVREDLVGVVDRLVRDAEYTATALGTVG